MLSNPDLVSRVLARRAIAIVCYITFTIPKRRWKHVALVSGCNVPLGLRLLISISHVLNLVLSRTAI